MIEIKSEINISNTFTPPLCCQIGESNGLIISYRAPF
nr:MAG TPA: hypothetical protein [Caudoviricetes sp.]